MKDLDTTPWTCQESVGNLGTPKLAQGKVRPQKSAIDGQGSKKKAIAIVKNKSLSVNEDIELSSSGGECRNPTLKEV